MLTVEWSYRLPLAFRRWLPLKGVTNKKVSAADLHADKFKSALTSSGPPRTRDAAKRRPLSRPPRRRLTAKMSFNTHYSSTRWPCAPYVNVLTRPDATVTLGWPTVHEKTSRSAYGALEPTSGNGVRWAHSDRPYVTYDFSSKRLGDGCTDAAGCQWHLWSTTWHRNRCIRAPYCTFVRISSTVKSR